MRVHVLERPSQSQELHSRMDKDFILHAKKLCKAKTQTSKTFAAVIEAKCGSSGSGGAK